MVLSLLRKCQKYNEWYVEPVTTYWLDLYSLSSETVEVMSTPIYMKKTSYKDDMVNDLLEVFNNNALVFSHGEWNRRWIGVLLRHSLFRSPVQNFVGTSLQQKMLWYLGCVWRWRKEGRVR